MLEFYLTYGSKGSVLHEGPGACGAAAGQSGGAFFTRGEARVVLTNGDAKPCGACVNLLPIK